MSNSPHTKKTAVIIGAGPAGLTCALELQKHTDITPIILEKSEHLGGISRTIRFGAHKMDIGGHRFFSKSNRVINWWLDILPLEKTNDPITLFYQNEVQTLTQKGSLSKDADDVMLVRERMSRIFYGGKFYEYPITLSLTTLKNLGLLKLWKIGFTYLWALFFPRTEKNLEDFFINRFGNELYLTFFKAYTQKVWGRSCTQLSADWGRQRIKGLSVWKTLTDNIARLFRKNSIAQKHTETSLIEHFLYPKYGPGQLWEAAAKRIRAQGGTFVHNAAVTKVQIDGDKATDVHYVDCTTSEEKTITADYVFSTMPIDELCAGLTGTIPLSVREVGTSLEYRDFITVGLLVAAEQKTDLTDNWIYIHDPHVKVGRIQFFHNWSPAMIGADGMQLLGLEYFCNKGDDLWSMSTEEIGQLAIAEARQIGIIHEDVIEFHVEKVEKAYPAYTGTFRDFSIVRDYLDTLTNFYPIGRNGMHRYNNQDHSMLTAMASVEALLGLYNKKDIWDINAEQDYHEEK